MRHVSNLVDLGQNTIVLEVLAFVFIVAFIIGRSLLIARRERLDKQAWHEFRNEQEPKMRGGR